MRTYHIISGLLFGLIAVMHILRLINHWTLIVGSWHAPMAASVIGLIVTAWLSIWSFSLIQMRHY